MLKVFTAVLLVLVIFGVAERHRLYIHDPFATVTRDGAREPHAQVFVDYSKNVMVENDHPPLYAEIVQNGLPIGVPRTLHCIHYVVCLMDSDPQPILTPNPDAEIESMDNHLVRYRDTGQRETVVTLYQQ